MTLYVGRNTADWSTGSYINGGYSNSLVTDETATKFAPGGSNGCSLIMCRTWDGGERIVASCWINWTTEWSPTIDIMVQAHSDEMTNQASHEFQVIAATPQAAAPASGNSWGGAADNKLTIWGTYGPGMYLINRSGYSTYLSVINFQ